MACWSGKTKAVPYGGKPRPHLLDGPLHRGEFRNEHLPVHDSVQNLDLKRTIFPFRERTRVWRRSAFHVLDPHGQARGESVRTNLS
jgi:hypothetical protein